MALNIVILTGYILKNGTIYGIRSIPILLETEKFDSEIVIPVISAIVSFPRQAAVVNSPAQLR
jgi:hypothetical protein